MKQTNQGGFNLGGINASGQIPDFTTHVALIDPDTPKSAHSIQSYMNPNKEMVLVFSDEFNQDGRSFYPGDDPYWEAADLHYWGTVSLNVKMDCLRLITCFQDDLEWYDPIQGRFPCSTKKKTLLATPILLPFSNDTKWVPAIEN